MSTVADYLGDEIAAELVTQDQEEAQPVEPITEAETTIAKPPTATDDHYFDQLELLGKMAECERKRQELQSELTEVDEHRKDLKARLKSCQIDMQEIASDIRDLMANTYIPERKEFAGIPSPKSEAPGEQPPMVDAEWGDGQWREASTREVMTGVKGLGEKKLDALADLAPTIGDLEDLRGTSYGVFKNVLPQGFGDKVASEIEDRLIEHIRKQSSPPASEQVKLNVVSDDDDPGQGSEEAAEQKEIVLAFIETFRNDAEIEAWDETDCDLDDKVVLLQSSDESKRGYDDHKAGLPPNAFPTDWSDGDLSDWAYGYVCGEVMARIRSEKKPAKKQAAKKPVDDFADL
jgi:hypothetical protein